MAAGAHHSALSSGLSGIDPRVIYLPATGRRVQTAAQKATVETGQLLRLWPIYLMIIPMFIAVYMPNIQVSFLLRDDGVTSAPIQSYVILTAH